MDECSWVECVDQRRVTLSDNLANCLYKVALIYLARKEFLFVQIILMVTLIGNSTFIY